MPAAIINKIKRTFRLRYILKCLRALFFDGTRPSPTVPQTLLIVRLDAIGDYVLFRNFLEKTRSSSRFKNYRITLCGNELWKDLAEEFDHAFVDEWIWVNKGRFTTDALYRKNILEQIAAKGFEVAVCPNAARDFLLGDAVIRASHARERIGSAATLSIDNWLFGSIGSFFYTTLIDTRKPAFEFDKNKLFFGQVLGQKQELARPYFNLPLQARGNTIVIIPGAGEPARQWHVDYFTTVVSTLLQDEKYTVIIAGAPGDKKLADTIVKNTFGKVEDLTGKTSLSGLVRLMAEAALVIAHDSGGLHLAAATNTNAIGLMTGKHYKRFAPYTNRPGNMRLIFPQPEGYYEALFQKHGPSYFEDVISDINQIHPDVVIGQSNILLHEIPAGR